MMRPIGMLVVVGMLAFLSIKSAHATFSEFARITPETEERHNIYVQILPVEGQQDKYKIMPPKAPDWLSAYLIICKEKVPPQKQNFREYIWSGWQGRADVLSLAPLLPPGQYWPANLGYVIPPKPAEVILDKSLITRSYLYIDFPHNVSDGGYYYCIDLATYPLPGDRKTSISYSPAQGLGPESEVMRQDPSDIIRALGQYYLWYVKGEVGHTSDAAIWYATSADGHTWVEKGEALPPGPEGSWDGHGVSAPNILVAEHKYWLFYTGVSKPIKDKGNAVTKSAIGIATADSPDGPWKRLSTNPVLECDKDPKRFDSLWVDASCLLARDGKYWLYYKAKGMYWGDASPKIREGLTIAEKPEGPYVPYVANPPIKSGHAVLVWPLGAGAAAMIERGAEGVAATLLYAPDGLVFSKMQDLDIVLRAPGTYRPEAFTDSGKGRMIEWGVHTGHEDGYPPFIERFDCQW